MMSEVTRLLTLKDPVPQVGWLMFGKYMNIKSLQYCEFMLVKCEEIVARWLR